MKVGGRTDKDGRTDEDGQMTFTFFCFYPFGQNVNMRQKAFITPHPNPT